AGLCGAVGLLLIGGCARPAVKVDGSSTVYPITEAVAEEFRAEHPDVNVIGGRSGTGGGFKKFSNGEIDICGASRPIKDTEQDACRAAGVVYIELEIAFDGLAVVVNPKNDWVDCMTVEQLKAIWQPESAVAKWSDVDPKWPAEEIELYGPGTDSGTFDYFTEVIVGETGKSRDDYTQSEDDNVLVTGVAGDRYSLGYFGLAYYEENRDKLKLLGIDARDGNCVKPTSETVRDNSYRPLSRPLFIYVRKSSLERPEVRLFVQFYLDRVGSLVPAVGYVPVPDEVATKNKQLLEEALNSSGPAT
ncbi:MAG: PstS family phosphate ABC transporter substrate-binding protein, partial [Pirellulales bacterium]